MILKNLDKILSNSYNANQSFKDYNNNLITNSLNSNKKSLSKDYKGLSNYEERKENCEAV